MSDFDIGSVISNKQKSTIVDYLTKGSNLEITVQGKIVADAPTNGHYVSPTLFAGVDPKHSLA